MDEADDVGEGPRAPSRGDALYVQAVAKAGGFVSHVPCERQSEPSERQAPVLAIAAPVRRPASQAENGGGRRPSVASGEARGGVADLRPVAALSVPLGGKPLKRSPVPAPPRIAWLALDQLVIDAQYQREISDGSERMIRKMVTNWDWSRFKPLSVAPSGPGRYEIIDGQHTAIAAATHGAIDSLPCLVLTVTTLEERAAAFVGINRDRTSLKPFALFKGRLAAGEAQARAVQGAVDRAGCRIVETITLSGQFQVGDVSCVSTLAIIAKARTVATLERLLRIAVAAGLGPIPAPLLQGLASVVGDPDEDLDTALAGVIARIGGERLMARAADYAAQGLSRRAGLARVLRHELGLADG